MTVFDVEIAEQTEGMVELVSNGKNDWNDLVKRAKTIAETTPKQELAAKYLNMLAYAAQLRRKI